MALEASRDFQEFPTDDLELRQWSRSLRPALLSQLGFSLLLFLPSLVVPMVVHSDAQHTGSVYDVTHYETEEERQTRHKAQLIPKNRYINTLLRYTSSLVTKYVVARY